MRGERSGLFFEIVRIIKEMRHASGGQYPAFVLLENVPGLLSSNGGRDFAVVLRELAEAGAMDIAWTILDAQWFGLAQRRKRVFVVADFRGERAGEILSVPTRLPWDSPPRRETWTRVASGLTADSATGSGVNRPGRRREDDTNIVHSIGTRIRHDDNAAAAAAQILCHTLKAEGVDGSEDGTGRGVPIVFDERNVTSPDNRAACRPGDHEKPMVVAFKRSYFTERPEQSGKPSELAPTMTSDDSQRSDHATCVAFQTRIARNGRGQPSDSKPHVAGSFGVRRLTPRECERLQGFPDDWTRYGDDGKEISDSARYRMIGNAVAVPVVEWIGRRILAKGGLHVPLPSLAPPVEP